MNLHKLISWSLASLLGLILMGIVSAFAAANSVPISRATDQFFAITANALKPPECAHLNLTHIVVIGAGQTPQGNRDELILGTPGNDVINGGPGDDCILGGGGNDTLSGGVGNDVLLGGPGNDSLDGGQGRGNNICYGGGQPGDTFDRCDFVFP